MITCQNCESVIAAEARFCPHCGEKTDNERITLKKLVIEIFTRIFGWDNKYFLTIRTLILRPRNLFTEYIGGIRSRYAKPFGFFAIGAAIAVLVFSQFEEQYLSLMTEMNKGQFEVMDEALVENFGDDPAVQAEMREKQRQQYEMNIQVQKFILKYFNLFSFLLLPLYTLVAFWVFGKPYNYGEHLVINAYIQGVTFLLSAIFFLTSIWVNPHLYAISMLVMIGYYTYAYSKLYQFTFGQALLRVGKFILVLLACAIVLLIISVGIGFVIGAMMK